MTGDEPPPPLDPTRFPDGWRGLKVLFVTGRLAETLVRRVVGDVSSAEGFTGEVHVLGVTVAALMHVELVRRKLTADVSGYDLIVLPGWCQGDVEVLTEVFGRPVIVGPKEILHLPEWLDRPRREPPELSRYDIEIIAEINHAPRMTTEELLALARRYRKDGADVVDVGCIPGESWSGVGDVVRLLCDEGLRVSIDSFDRREVEAAVKAGAELVLSCNRSNLDWAVQLPAEFVAIPDAPSDLASLDRTVEALQTAGARSRLDPILEPVGFGFTESLARYIDVRRRYPGAAMMMGIGNVTELAQVDSAGLNFLLAAVCQELRVDSILTTEVAPWCRTAVREFDLARRLVRHAVQQRTLVKHLPQSLLMLRDEKVTSRSESVLESLAAQITDRNVRLFVEGGRLHLINRDGHWRGTDPFELFDRFLTESSDVDSAHAFYLGYELAKATTALTLGKQYSQDHPLNWGMLTQPESSVHDLRRRNAQDGKD